MLIFLRDHAPWPLPIALLHTGIIGLPFHSILFSVKAIAKSGIFSDEGYILYIYRLVIIMVLHSGRWILDIGWLIFLIILLIHFWRERTALLRAQSWLKTKGHVTRCEWVEAGHSIWPKIEYSYQVFDKDLVGEYLFLDTSHNNPHSKYSRLIAYKAAMAFKENSEIDVYYNPNHPDQSALDVTIPVKLNIILILICSLVFLHLGIIFFRLWS